MSDSQKQLKKWKIVEYGQETVIITEDDRFLVRIMFDRELAYHIVKLQNAKIDIVLNEYINLLLGEDTSYVDVENDRLEIYRLKELLCTIRECAVTDFNDTTEKLACKGLEKDFRIPESRFKEILESL